MGKEGERVEDKHLCVVASRATLLGTWPTTQACALTGNRTSDPLVRRPALNPLSHTSQGKKGIFYLMASSCLKYLDNKSKGKGKFRV